ncbi:unnamed protein product, partial [Cladocopium goreaui]
VLPPHSLQLVSLPAPATPGRPRPAQPARRGAPGARGALGETADVWRGLRALQGQQQQQVEVLERLQCESQQDHLKLLQLATRVEHLELSSQSWPNFLQRELESRLLQEREMQRVLQTQGATWSIQAAEQGLAKLEATVQGLAQRFEARVQHVEMGSDVKVAEGILQAEPLAAEQLTAAVESRLTEIHLTLREHSNALERIASAQHGLEDAMAGLRLSCAQEFSALEGLQGLEKRMQTVERSFGEVGNSQKLLGQMKHLQTMAAEGAKRCDQLQDEVSQQSRFAQDLHVAQLHNDTAVELQSQRLDERLGRLEEEWKMRKVYKSAGDNSEELKALWQSISLLTGRVEMMEAQPRSDANEPRPLRGAEAPRAAALSAVEKMEAATQRLMAYRP